MVFKNRVELEKLLTKREESKNRCEVYLNAYDKGVNIYPYLKSEIPTGRLKQILVGLSQGLDVSWYDDYTVFRKEQMKLIREGLKLGLDVSWYAKPEYNKYQMTVIKAGLEKGLDVSIYADHRLSASQMWQYFNRMRRGGELQKSSAKQANYGRFNLADFEFQRVDFEGIVQECKIISPYKYAILVKNLYWQGEYVCDHVWINSLTKATKKIMVSGNGFDFGDKISFSAEIEPYYHNKDKQKHYGLCRMGEIEVIEKTDYYNNYKMGHKLYINIEKIQFYDNEKKESTEAEREFRRFFDIDDSIEQLTLKLIGIKKDDLVFQISYQDIVMNQKGLYNPYNGKGRIKVGKTNYFYPLTDYKSKKDRKLGNTFFLGKYLGMIDVFEIEQIV